MTLTGEKKRFESRTRVVTFEITTSTFTRQNKEGLPRFSMPDPSVCAQVGFRA
jgi:hypothetical protein